MFVVLVVLTSANYLTRTKHDAKQRKPPPDVGGHEEVFLHKLAAVLAELGVDSRRTK
jgi:hypothetical protein